MTPIKFTKMHGAGNDFIVINGIDQSINFSARQWQWLADRRFGVGADQILLVERAKSTDVDFNYRIFNGGEVEHCGNGARCFAVFVRDEGLTTKQVIRVQIQSGVIVLQLLDDGQVKVDMGVPLFGPESVDFDTSGLTSSVSGEISLWPLPTDHGVAPIALVSMGNPHAVQVVADVEAAPVLTQGSFIQSHARFAKGVNAGFLQLVDRHTARIRVFERGSGETLACGTGICAAAAAAMAQGLADSPLHISAKGGALTVHWSSDPLKGYQHSQNSLFMTGPATRVFSGIVTVPEIDLRPTP
jgi:diaminopimelate epimerase